MTVERKERRIRSGVSGCGSLRWKERRCLLCLEEKCCLPTARSRRVGVCMHRLEATCHFEEDYGHHRSVQSIFCAAAAAAGHFETLPVTKQHNL